MRRDDQAAALADLERAIKNDPAGPLSPSAAYALEQKGEVLLKLKRYAEAVKAFDAALVLVPDQLEAYLSRAKALLSENHFADAVKSLDGYFERERERRKSQGEVYRARARAQSRLGNYAEAAEDYTRSLELEPDDTTTRANRGWAYVVLEESRLALRDFDKVLQALPDNGDAHNGRGYARVRLGHYRDGIQDAEKALQLGPKDTRTYYNAARTYAQAVLRVAEQEQGKPDAALRELRLKYAERALALLSQAIEGVPASQRTSFWVKTIQPDSGLNPIRRTPGFLQLADKYGDEKLK
jgi:tetratricopeptide (TPR) repeat protein